MFVYRICEVSIKFTLTKFGLGRTGFRYQAGGSVETPKKGRYQLRKGFDLEHPRTFNRNMIWSTLSKAVKQSLMNKKNSIY